jgi:hypothetical protein
MSSAANAENIIKIADGLDIDPAELVSRLPMPAEESG